MDYRTALENAFRRHISAKVDWFADVSYRRTRGDTGFEVDGQVELKINMGKEVDLDHMEDMVQDVGSTLSRLLRNLKAIPVRVQGTRTHFLAQSYGIVVRCRVDFTWQGDDEILFREQISKALQSRNVNFTEY